MANFVTDNSPEALARALLDLSGKHNSFFQTADGTSYKEKDSAWIEYLENEIKRLGLDLSAAQLTPKWKTTFFAAITLIDQENNNAPDGKKCFLHEDVVRAISWNKGTSNETDFRRTFWSYECAAQPITGYGAFRMFYARGYAGQKNTLSNLFGFWSKTPALDRLRDIAVLTITRHDKMQGLLGGLTDLLDPNQPFQEQLKRSIEERLGNTLLKAFGIDAETLPELTAQSNLLGLSHEQAVDGITGAMQQRALIEAVDAASVPLKILVDQFVRSYFLTASGRADNVTLVAGVYKLLNLSDQDAQIQVAGRSSRGESIEELKNVVEALEAGHYLQETEEQKDIRHALMDQLKALVEKLEAYDTGLANCQVDNIDPAQAGVTDPLGGVPVRLPIQSVLDGNFPLEMWSPKDFSDAVRPPKFPKARLVRPMGSLQEIAAETMNMLHDAGVEAKQVIERLKTSTDEKIAEIVKGLEVRGMERRTLPDTLKMCGSTSGRVCEKETGFDDQNFRYQHEWAAPLFAAVKELAQNPLFGKSPDKTVIQALAELQREIIASSRATGHAPYLLQINTALRMMQGGRMEQAAQGEILARDFGLAANTFVMAQQACIDEVIKAGYVIKGYAVDKAGQQVGDSVSVTNGSFAFGPAPLRLIVEPEKM